MKPQNLRAALAGAAGAVLGLFLWGREIPPAAERTLAAIQVPAGSPELGVLLARNRDAVKVSVSGRFRLFGRSGGEIATKNESLAPVRVRTSGGGLAVGDARLKESAIEFRPAPGEEVCLDGLPIPGALRIERGEDGVSVSAIGLMDVELFVCAALAGTGAAGQAPAAAEAHAICWRTLALYRNAVRKDSRESSGYDIDEPRAAAAILDGSYRSATCVRAANRTRGIVLSWDARLFPATITASCGGRTEDASNVFTAASITPLSGAVCPHCASIEPGASEWQVKLSAKRITESLRPSVEGRGVYKLGAVRRVEIAATGSSGRATRIRLDTAYGPVEIDAALFVSALGEDTLPSALFTIREAGPELFEFAGRGRGPGVGLCARGAAKMAEEEASCEEILARYFPGAVLAKLSYAAVSGVRRGFR